MTLDGLQIRIQGSNWDYIVREQLGTTYTSMKKYANVEENIIWNGYFFGNDII